MKSSLRSSNMFDFRRWVIVTIGKNSQDGRYCVMGNDHQQFSAQIHFGSLDIRNVDAEKLTAAEAREVLHYHSHSDIFVMLLQDTDFNRVRELFQTELQQQPLRGHLCIGKYVDGKVMVVSADGNSFVQATKPETCPNWNPQRPFQMPNGSVINGISIAAVA